MNIPMMSDIFELKKTDVFSCIFRLISIISGFLGYGRLNTPIAKKVFIDSEGFNPFLRLGSHKLV
jgi:hypothetical protein